MAATVPKFLPAALLAACLLLAAPPDIEISHQVTQVAMALTAGHAEEALAPFDKSFSGYERLRDYFTALTNAYQLVNEIEITDEEISDTQATLTIHWEMNLDDSQRRGEDLHLKLALRAKKWRIIELSPIEFFNPQLRRSK